MAKKSTKKPSKNISSTKPTDFIKTAWLKIKRGWNWYNAASSQTRLLLTVPIMFFTIFILHKLHGPPRIYYGRWHFIDWENTNSTAFVESGWMDGPKLYGKESQVQIARPVEGIVVKPRAKLLVFAGVDGVDGVLAAGYLKHT